MNGQINAYLIFSTVRIVESFPSPSRLLPPCVTDLQQFLNKTDFPWLRGGC